MPRRRRRRRSRSTALDVATARPPARRRAGARHPQQVAAISTVPARTGSPRRAISLWSATPRRAPRRSRSGRSATSLRVMTRSSATIGKSSSSRPRPPRRTHAPTAGRDAGRRRRRDPDAQDRLRWLGDLPARRTRWTKTRAARAPLRRPRRPGRRGAPGRGRRARPLAIAERVWLSSRGRSPLGLEPAAHGLEIDAQQARRELDRNQTTKLVPTR